MTGAAGPSSKSGALSSRFDAFSQFNAANSVRAESETAEELAARGPATESSGVSVDAIVGARAVAVVAGACAAAADDAEAALAPQRGGPNGSKNSVTNFYDLT